MPNQPKPGRHHRSLVFWNGQWWVGKPVTKQMGTSRNAVIEQMWQWYLRTPGVELPERPPLEVIQQAYAEWRKQQGADETDEPMPGVEGDSTSSDA